MRELTTRTSSKEKFWAAIAAAALSLVIALGFAIPTQASAAEGSTGLAVGGAQLTTQYDVSMLSPNVVDLWVGCYEDIALNHFLSNIDGVKVTSATSSNPSVLNVKKVDSENTIWSYKAYPLKAGNAKLTVTVTQNGTTKTLSETYTVKVMPNIIASLSLNGESLPVPSAKNPITRYDYFGFKGNSATVNAKAASGWEITSMSGNYFKQGSSGTSFEVTNGKAFNVPTGQQDYFDVGISLHNSASNEYFYFSLSVNRTYPIELVAKPTYYIGHPKHCPLWYKMLFNPDYITVLSVKSSKPSVIAVKSSKSIRKVTLQAKKPGKSKITVKYKYMDRTYTVSAMSTASKDYPVKSVLVNGKSINLKKHGRNYSPKTYKKNKAKIKIKAAKGWKIKSLKRYTGYLDENGVKTKNGKAIKTPKGQVTTVVATLKKGKKTFSYGWIFNRA